MVKGNKKSFVDVDDLLYYTDGGKEIYQLYLGEVKRVMKRPWGTDNHPSWGVFPVNGVWIWKDQATEESGGPVQFVQTLFNLTWSEALEKINKDLKLDDKATREGRIYRLHAPEQKKYAHITAKTRKFGNRHHKFWNAAEVNEDWCKKHNCFAVKELSINRKKVAISEEERVFVYLADDINKVKVYFPDRPRDTGERFRTNVPGNYLWGFNKLEGCDKLVIHKSNKDLIVFSLLFPCNITTQSESIKVFDKANVDRINGITKEPWVFYGSDMDGVRKCTTITDTNGWRYINTPQHMLPEVNDVYSFVKKHGLKELEKFCQAKGLL